MEQSLRVKLDPFFRDLPFSDVVLAQQAVGEYVLLRDSRRFNANVDTLDKETRVVFLEDVKDLINTDHVSRCIWRATYLALRKNMKWDNAAEKYGIAVDDMLFCWDPLDTRIHRKIRAAARATQLLSFMSHTQLNDLVTSLVPFCRTVAYKKLRFIEDNDHAYAKDDLAQELLVQAIKVIRRYEHFSKDGKTHDIQKIRNFARSAINNYATNMIGRHTNVARARVENVTRTCGYCTSCKSGKLSKCENVIQDFRQTTLRLDIPMTDDNSTLYDLLRFTDDNTVDAIDNLNNYIKRSLSPRMRTFVDIVVSGKSSYEFDVWLRENYCTSVDDLLYNQRKLAKHVMRFLNLDEDNVRRELAPKCSGYSSKLRSKCVSCGLFTWCKHISTVRSTSDACNEYTPIYMQNNNL